MNVAATSTSPSGFTLRSLRAIRSIAWQQLKATQALRYLVMGGIVGLQWFMPAMLEPQNVYQIALGWSFLLILTFALIAPSLVLTADWESRTRSRRLMFPTSWRTTCAVLVGIGLGDLILLAALAAANWLLVARVFGIHSIAVPFDNWLRYPKGTLIFGTLFVLMAYAFGVFGASRDAGCERRLASALVCFSC